MKLLFMSYSDSFWILRASITRRKLSVWQKMKALTHETPVLLSYRSQSTDLLCKSIDWFLYNTFLEHWFLYNTCFVVKAHRRNRKPPKVHSWQRVLSPLFYEDPSPSPPPPPPPYTVQPNFSYFKNYSLIEVTHLLIRFNKTKFFLWNTENTDGNGVNICTDVHICTTNTLRKITLGRVS